MERPIDNPTYKIKPTNTELRRRLDIVESLVIDCASVPDIMRYFTEKEGLKLARRTIEGYVQFVEKRIQKAAEPRRELEIRKAVRRFERCFARAISGNKKNVSAAIAAQKALNDLLGLNPRKDGEEELNIEQLASMMIAEQKEMDRIMRGPAGIRSEILDLCQRYKGLSVNSDELLQEMSQLLHSSSNNSGA